MTLRARLRPCRVLLVVTGVLFACGGNQADAPPPATPPTGAPEAAPTPPAPTSPAPTSSAPSSGEGQLCATRGAGPCPSGMFCNFKPGDDCGATDKGGQCASRPAACPRIAAPVCGCDGKTYGNGCEANAAGVGVKKNGGC